jgi:hypothetical protein
MNSVSSDSYVSHYIKLFSAESVEEIKCVKEYLSHIITDENILHFLLTSKCVTTLLSKLYSSSGGGGKISSLLIPLIEDEIKKITDDTKGIYDEDIRILDERIMSKFSQRSTQELTTYDEVQKYIESICSFDSCYVIGRNLFPVSEMEHWAILYGGEVYDYARNMSSTAKICKSSLKEFLTENKNTSFTVYDEKIPYTQEIKTKLSLQDYEKEPYSVSHTCQDYVNYVLFADKEKKETQAKSFLSFERNSYQKTDKSKIVVKVKRFGTPQKEGGYSCVIM